MVTLLTPNSASSQETTVVQEQEFQPISPELDEAFQQVFARARPMSVDNTGKSSHQAQTAGRFITGISHPLVALYDLLSGPAMTQRERHLKEVHDAAVRNNVSLSWFSRTTW